jgi:hypothetical protein
MRIVLFAAVTVLFLGAGHATAQIMESGSFVVDLSQYTPPTHGEPFETRCNVLGNPGFETGSLPPWTTNGWTVTDEDAYAGIYSAESYGNIHVEQFFTPLDVSQVISVTMWSKQPEGIAFQAVDFFYSPTDYDEFLVGPGVDWTFIDMTSQLRPAGMLQGIRIWGYSGGGPEPDLIRVDDVIIEDEGGSPAQVNTWGLIKSLYQ